MMALIGGAMVVGAAAYAQQQPPEPPRATGVENADQFRSFDGDPILAHQLPVRMMSVSASYPENASV